MNTRVEDCVACTERRAEMRQLECGHVVLCQHCSREVFRRERRCPTCRTKMLLPLLRWGAYPPLEHEEEHFYDAFDYAVREAGNDLEYIVKAMRGMDGTGRGGSAGPMTGGTRGRGTPRAAVHCQPYYG